MGKYQVANTHFLWTKLSSFLPTDNVSGIMFCFYPYICPSVKPTHLQVLQVEKNYGQFQRI